MYVIAFCIECYFTLKYNVIWSVFSPFKCCSFLIYYLKYEFDCDSEIWIRSVYFTKYLNHLQIILFMENFHRILLEEIDWIFFKGYENLLYVVIHFYLLILERNIMSNIFLLIIYWWKNEYVQLIQSQMIINYFFF